MANPKLRVVTPDDAPTAPQTVLEAAVAGDRMGELVAMRRRIAAALDSPKTLARDLASLSRRLLEIGKEIEALQVERDEEALAGGDVEDEAWSAI